MRFLPGPLAFVFLVVAVFCVGPHISGTLRAAESGGDMPDTCKQNLLDKCSEKFWPRDSLHRGDTKSITFSNGYTLTCTSVRANVPRSCKLDPPIRTNADPHDQTIRQQCALKEQLSALMEVQDSPQTSVGQMRSYFARLMQMTPAMLDQEIKALQSLQESHRKQRPPCRPAFLGVLIPPAPPKLDMTSGWRRMPTSAQSWIS
jgi:hypothetical protein